MTDRVRIFTRAGRALTEVDASVVRSWKLARTVDYAHGDISIATTHAKATTEYFHYGNFVFVESSHSGLLSWAGKMWPPLSVEDGKLKMSLRSAESILGERTTDAFDEYNNYTPGEIFKSLITRYGGGLPIDMENEDIIEFGNQIKVEYNLENLYEAGNKLANDNDYFWWFEPSVGSDKRLQLRPRFRPRRGGDHFSRDFVEGRNLRNIELTEDIDFANRIIAYGQIESWKSADEHIAIAKDDKSIHEYGRIDYVMPCLDIMSQDVIGIKAKRELKKRAWPRLNIMATITDPPFPRVGAEITCVFSQSNPLLMRRGQKVEFSIQSLAYDPNADALEINATEILSSDMKDE